MSTTMSSNVMDDSGRPNKRHKTEPSIVKERLNPLPPPILLLSLQSLLAHPPTHRNYPCSLVLTLFALRKCLTLSGLDSMTECRAWTELVEAGFRIGLDAPGIESELEKAITKALLIANKHPSLRPYKPRLTWLSANLASYQHNTKFAQTNLKDLLAKFLAPSDPPHATYFSHLAYINNLSRFPDSRDSSHTSSKVCKAICDLQEVALRNNHPDIVSLTMVLELRELLQSGVWARLHEVLKKTEELLNISLTLDCGSPSSPPTPTKNLAPCLGSTNLQTVLMVYTLVIGILFFTYAGDGANAQIRMKKLHEMLDGGAIKAFGESGIVKVDFPDTPLSSLEVQVIHPRLLFSLGFLVSSVAKRDPLGRKPKRKLFAHEGVLTVERELRTEASFPVWASISDVQEFQQRMHKIKADMICELIGVAITRSEYEAAERDIFRVVAHTRSHGLFSIYSARITLHLAHLAHALGQTERALKCYQVAAFLSRKKTHSPSKRTFKTPEEDEGCEDYWVNVSARAGELWLRIGLASMIDDEIEWMKEMEVLRKKSVNILKECEGLGGTLQAVGAVLTACLSKEFLVAKTQFRNALNLSSAAQDNHLRALIFALVAGQYVHTSAEYAEDVLNTAEELAAGLGAQPKVATGTPKGNHSTPKKSSVAANDGVGNAHLRLWIGERSLELKRRAGNEERVLKQTEFNRKLDHATENLKKRKISQIS